MGNTVLPPQAHALAAQLEDALTTWQQRDPAHPHPRVREAGETACRLCDEMVVVWHELRQQLAAELGAYDDARRRMGR